MKLRLHWAEKYEVVREYPSFELDSEEFPELELEMLQVHNAQNTRTRDIALANLEYKMHQIYPEGGENVFQMFGPHDQEKYDQSVLYALDDEECGCIQLTTEEK
tara:strand:- start:4223 stop:4534 length:312 start_codon:yes stop_codon:yes gene_type:complete